MKMSRKIYFLKYANYFSFIRKRQDRIIITDDWIMRVMKNPVRVEIQSDGRIRKWCYIPEMKKYLRIVLLEDGETVHNASFDRRFKEEPS